MKRKHLTEVTTCQVQDLCVTSEWKIGGGQNLQEQ